MQHNVYSCLGHACVRALVGQAARQGQGLRDESRPLSPGSLGAEIAASVLSTGRKECAACPGNPGGHLITSAPSFFKAMF